MSSLRIPLPHQLHLPVVAHVKPYMAATEHWTGDNSTTAPQRGEVGQRGRIGDHDIRVLDAIPPLASEVQHAVSIDTSRWHCELELEEQVAVAVRPSMRVEIPRMSLKAGLDTFQDESS